MTTVTTKQKVGLVLAGLMCLGNLPSVFESAPDGDVGPPVGILVVDTVLAVIGLVALVPAWRGNGAALRVVAGVLVVSALTGLPAFFVDVPSWVKAVTAASVLYTIATLVLMFSTARRPAPVLD
jgi:hypothetical protein